MKEDTQKYIGKIGTIKLGKLLFDVMIIGVKSAYGSTLYQIRPITGTGVQWVRKVNMK